MPSECPDGWSIDNLPKIVHIDSGQIAICKQCEDMNSCPSIRICKSCGGRPAPRVIAPCPR
jgi:hypothetical protein